MRAANICVCWLLIEAAPLNLTPSNIQRGTRSGSQALLTGPVFYTKSCHIPCQVSMNVCVNMACVNKNSALVPDRWLSNHLHPLLLLQQTTINVLACIENMCCYKSQQTYTWAKGISHKISHSLNTITAKISAVCVLQRVDRRWSCNLPNGSHHFIACTSNHNKIVHFWNVTSSESLSFPIFS